MRYCWICSLLILVACINLPAQNIRAYFARKDGACVFIDSTGAVVKATGFGQIGKVNLPYFGQYNTRSNLYWIEKEGKVGLADTLLRTVLEPLWDEVQVLTPDCFLVRTNEQYTIVDTSGEEMLNGARYAGIRLLQAMRTDYFLVQDKNGLWGVQQRNGALYLPIKFGQLEFLPIGEGCFRFKNNAAESQWTLMSWTKTKLLTQYDFLPAGGNYFLSKEKRDADWIFRNIKSPKTGLDTLDGKTSDFIFLNKHLFGVRLPGNSLYSLYLNSAAKALYHRLDSLWAVDQQLACYRYGKDFGLIDSLGNIVPVMDLKDLQPGASGLYRMRCASGKWGLYTIGTGMSLACTFDAISAFTGPVAITLREGRNGLLSKNNKEILPPAFDRVKVEEEVVKAYVDSLLVRLELDQQGEIVSQDTFLYQTVSVGMSLSTYREFLEPDEFEDEDSDSTSTGNTTAGQANNSKTQAVSLLKTLQFPTSDSLALTEQLFWKKYYSGYQLMRSLSEEEKEKIIDDKIKKDWKLRFNKDKIKVPNAKKVVSVNFTQLTETDVVDWTLCVQPGYRGAEVIKKLSIQKGVYAQMVFLNAEKTMLKNFDILGIRLKDFNNGQRYAAFIDPAGKMGLIDKNGAQVMDAAGQPFRADFIDTLQDGLYRFCINAQLDTTSKKVNPRTVLSDVATFLVEFHIVHDNNDGPGRNSVNKKLIARPRNKNNKIAWGYLDSGGLLVIPPAFEYSTNFTDGIALVKSKKKWGLINKTGQVVVAPEFDEMSLYQNHWVVYKKNRDTLFFAEDGTSFDKEKRAAQYKKHSDFVVFSDLSRTLWGYLRRNGDTLLAPQFEAARDFSEALACVRQNNRWYVIDTSGKIQALVDSTFDVADMGVFSEGCCWFSIKEKNARKYGFIDNKGHVCVKPDFYSVRPFRKGVSLAREKSNFVLVDKKGNKLFVPGKYDRLGDVNALDLVVVSVGDTNNIKNGLIHISGKEIVAPAYDDIRCFAGGCALKSGLTWQIIDKTGKRSTHRTFWDVKDMPDAGHLLAQDSATGKWALYGLPDLTPLLPDLSYAEPFKNGYALVKFSVYPNDSLFLYSLRGQIIAPPKGIYIKGWNEDRLVLERIGKNDKGEKMREAYFSDILFQPVFHQYFPRAAPFQYGMAEVKMDKKTGAINRHGILAVPAKYTFVRATRSEKVNFTVPPWKKGLYTYHGKCLVQPQYDTVFILPAGFIQVELGNKIGYINLDGQWIWELQ